VENEPHSPPPNRSHLNAGKFLIRYSRACRLTRNFLASSSSGSSSSMSNGLPPKACGAFIDATPVYDVTTTSADIP
jgi:hypothetical protein